MFLIFDTETTGLPKNFKAPITDTDNWPRVVQLAWQLHDENGKIIKHNASLVKPDGYTIPYDSEKVHGISTALAESDGKPLDEVIAAFLYDLKQATFIVGHNLNFDINVLGCEFIRLGMDSTLDSLPVLDTCTEESAALVQLSGGKGGKFKLPTLSELYFFLFKESFVEAHNATADVEATTRCFFELIRRAHFSEESLGMDSGYFSRFQETNPEPISLLGIQHQNLKEASKALKKTNQSNLGTNIVVSEELEEAKFTHLHVHSQFTLLQSTAEIKALINKAIQFDLPALAITDNGNMMAAFQFEKLLSDYNAKLLEEKAIAEENGSPFSKSPILPIIGCEFNICVDHKSRAQKDNGYKMVFLAKNKQGYQNLIKLSSLAYTEGFYYLPRIDKALVEKYCEDLIVLSGGLDGEITSLILNVGETQAEASLLWWKERFKEDFYLEINRHQLESEDHANEVLISFSKKHNVKLIATFKKVKVKAKTYKWIVDYGKNT